jgi:hypothetical protein
MSKANIYLSGAMEFADDGQLGADWRLQCTQRLNKMGYSAIDITALDVGYSSLFGDLFRCAPIAGGDINDYLQRKANIRQHFVHADLLLIERHTDAMIVKYCTGTRRGAGTISECQHAYNRGIPIFLVNTFQDDLEIPGWLFALTTKIFNTFEELYSYLEGLPDGILKLDQYQNRRSGNHYLCSLCGTVEEKHKAHFVSKVSPLYCKACVELVKITNESHKNRYEFFVESLDQRITDN